MIKQNTTCVWLKWGNGSYCRMAAGITSLKIISRPVLLETTHLNSALRSREPLTYTAQVEFEGYRDRDDPVCEHLFNGFLKRGDDAKVTFVTYDNRDVRFSGAFTATRQTGYLCMENPGSGEGYLGGKFKGKIVYATEPEKGAFNAETKQFTPF